MVKIVFQKKGRKILKIDEILKSLILAGHGGLGL
jgi:hypothetical protein